jgi:hypothetical protein
VTTPARVALLDLRTVAPYRRQIILAPLLVVAIMFDRPQVVVPALIMLCTSMTAGYPFMLTDRADLETLYAVLPLTRRSLLLGRYLWALMIFAVTIGLGTPAALILARAQHISLSAHTLTMILVVSWAMFALSVSIQFPLFLRYGYTRVGLLATTLPVAVVAMVALRWHLHVTVTTAWLVALVAAGAVLLGASLAVAGLVDPRRLRPAAALS